MSVNMSKPLLQSPFSAHRRSCSRYPALPKDHNTSLGTGGLPAGGGAAVCCGETPGGSLRTRGDSERSNV